MKRQQRILTLLCIAGGLGAMLLSLGICLIIFDIGGDSAVQTSAPAVTSLPYDESAPFTLADLTTQQQIQIRENGRIAVSDGPRGISIGDSLEELLERYPSTFTEKLSTGEQTGAITDEEMILYCAENLEKLNSSEQTGMQSDEEMILYCAEYFENQNGVNVALPPRGLLTVQSGSIVVTLLAPTATYPAGTKDNYGSYEHIYCVYTIEPDTMTVSSIVLGIDQ